MCGGAVQRIEFVRGAVRLGVILMAGPNCVEGLMNRRKFLSDVGKATTAAVAAGVGTVAVARDAVSDRYEDLKKRLDELEGSQKRALRALLVLTSVSTGLDGAALF